MKHTLECMEDKDVKFSVMPNFHREIPNTAKAEHPPLKQVENKPVVCFDETMM